MALLAALAYWRYPLGTAWLPGVGAPLLAAIVCGALVAPRARWPLPLQVPLVVALLLFATAQARPCSPHWSTG